MKTTTVTSVDGYIRSFPAQTQVLLNAMRKTIKAAAPGAEEVISYNMPAYKYKGILVYFAGYEKHIGFYALPTANLVFKKALEKYKVGKGSVQFPIDKQLPLALITRMVKYRVKENEAKQQDRKVK